MTERPTEGDEHDRAWNRDAEDVLTFLESLDRLDRWLGLPADHDADAEAYDRARTQANEDDDER